MGVQDNSIRMLLLHSKKTSLGALDSYFLRSSRELKQLRTEQMLLETVLETALEMEEKFGELMDLETIYEQLPVAFENLLKNPHYIYINEFKNQLIRFTFLKMEHAMLSNTSPYSNNATLFSIGKNSTSPFQTGDVNPYSYRQQVRFQSEGFSMLSTNMASQPQLTTNHYQSIYPNQLNSYDFSNKK
ncbi:hypothetical protein B1B04_17100 [Lysinibacillus sp. KCTC 33748]|uniref:hypothetical protein n=1 Tax=unclassified Lysinibacillus TaxID=2636778 RepID=UPI0009C66C13|nr:MULTISPECIES: hypothetical protein [unclassified Lysinibacillus]OXS72217.1 hypothetical protein B1B04_17100 [Lysinibacillus sp. KCTC 33748]SKB98728.1 hypothetical protein SAMN06295926_11581 [Lysinibacillus sp. AC-3]